MTYANPELLVRARARASSARVPRQLIVAVLVGIFYYVGAKLGFALTLRPTPISTLWPPNSILLAALLLTPTSWWWAILLAALPAHLAIELNSGFPTLMVLGWFVSNCSEALIGAGLVRALVKTPLRFDRSREVWIFVVATALAGTFLSSFLDVTFVTLSDKVPSSFWQLWRTRYLSNVLASITLVPAFVTWTRTDWNELLAAPSKRFVEGVVLGVGLVAISIFVFNGQKAGLNTAPVSLYAPLPFLLWATIRFGPRGTSACLLIVTFLSIWGAVHGHGPFLTMAPAQNAISIQAFLIVIAIPLLVLAALIREREQAERSARENEERLNLAMGAAQAGTWEWRIPENRMIWSPKSKQIFGVADRGKELTFEQCLELVVAEDREILAARIWDAVLHHVPYECEFRVVRPDSTTVWILGKGKALYDHAGRPRQILGVNVDVTERKSAEASRRQEAALRESEAQLRQMADAMPQIVWTATPDGHIDYFNGQWYALTGADNGTTKDDGWLFMTHPDDRANTIRAWRHAVATGQPCEVEHRLRLGHSGEFRWHLARAVPSRDNNGAVLRWYGSCTDIHDQKRVEQEQRNARMDLEARVAERTSELSSAVVQLRNEIAERVMVAEALRSSEERFAKAFHSSPDAIVIVRQSDYTFVEVNEKWAAMFGYSRSDVVGRSFDDLGLLRDDHHLGRALLEGTEPLRELELDVHNKFGEPLRIVAVADTMEMGGEACYIITIRDITERKHAESMLQEQQRELAHLSRVAALGELSGALAHELNQPLAAILANARAAQRMMSAEKPDRAEVHEILEDIAADDRRAGEVISRLRTLLRKGELQAKPVNLDDIVEEVLGIVHSDLIERRISVTTQVSPSLPPVMGDKVQLEQVLLNLVLNACDAMNDTPLADRRLTIAATGTAEGALQLSVSDQGVGIGSNRLEQIFDPFVTTKENGLGLGLAICRSIVTSHGGRLWAVNNVDRGATFFMMLNPADSALVAAADIRTRGAARARSSVRPVSGDLLEHL